MKHQKCHPQDETARRIYILCSFDRGLIVPRFELIDAATDDEALACARTRNMCNLRELWDGHRLVAALPPKSLEVAGY